MTCLAVAALLFVGALDLEDIQRRLEGAHLVVRGRAAADGTFEVVEVLKGVAPAHLSAATVPLPSWVDVLLIDDTPYRVVAAPGGDAILLDPSGEDPEFISPKDKRPRAEPETLALSEVKRMLHRLEPAPTTPVVRAVAPVVSAPTGTQPPAPAPAPAPPGPAPSVLFGTSPYLGVFLLVGVSIGVLILTRRRR